jgi:hypothetical protein
VITWKLLDAPVINLSTPELFACCVEGYSVTPHLTVLCHPVSSNSVYWSQGSINFPKIQESSPNSWCQRGVKTSSILNTHNSGVNSEPHCYLALSAQHMWTHTHFCMEGKKLQWWCWSIMRQRLKFGPWVTMCSGFGHPCQKSQNTCDIIKYNLPSMSHSLNNTYQITL